MLGLSSACAVNGWAPPKYEFSHFIFFSENTED